jgi:glycosyltransferase involved in cell wall biosynthesis
MPIVSVCIPSFNGSRTIRETINSVLCQEVDLELLISDGGSSDSTVSIIKSIDDSRIRLSLHENRLSAEENWNRSVAGARAPFVKVMGQDDLLFPGSLAKEIQALDSSLGSRAAFVYAKPALLINGRIVMRGWDYCHEANLESSEVLVRRIIKSGRNPIGEPVAVTMRREVFDLSNGFRGRYTIDLDLYYRLLECGPALRIPGPLSAFRVSKESWSSRLLWVQARETKDLHRRIYDTKQWSLKRSDRLIGALLASIYPFVRFIISRLVAK